MNRLLKFLALLALTTPLSALTIDTEQTYTASPAWSENVSITGTGKAILGQNVLIGQTTNITIDIASGGSLTLNSTLTDNHGAGNSLINANEKSLLFTGTGTFIKTGTGSLAMQSNGYKGTAPYDFSAKFAFSDGAIFDIQQGTFRNGGWTSQNWTENKADLRIASGATLDLWDGKDMTFDALVGAGTISTGQTVSRVLTIGAAGSTWSGEGTPEFSGSTTTSATQAKLIGLKKVGSGSQVLSGTWTGGNGLTLEGGTLQIGNGTTGKINSATTVSIGEGATLSFNSDEASTLSGVVSGSGTLTVTKGSVSLTNTANTFNGNWSVGEGGSLDSAVKLDTSKGSIGVGATFYMYVNDADTTKAYTSDEFSKLRATSAGTVGVTIPASTTSTSPIDKILAKNSDFTKTGAGTFQLTGTVPETFTSAIAVKGGALSLGDGTTAATINAATEITVDSGAQFIFNSGANSETVLMNKITGDGALVVASGTLKVTTDSPILGTVDLQGSYGVQNLRFGTSQVTVKDGAKLYIADQVTPSFNGKSGTFTIEAGGVMEVNTTAASGHNANNSAQGQNNTLTFNGAGTLLKTGSGAMALLNRAVNTTGSVVIAQSVGGWIDIQQGMFINGGWSGGINWNSNKGSVNVVSGAEFNGWDGTANSVLMDSLTGTGKVYGATFVLGTGNNETSEAYGVKNNTATFNGTITKDRASAVSKRGTGTQILTGVNTYEGVTTVEAGTLQVGDGTKGSIASSKTFLLTGGTLLFKTPTAHTANTLSGSGTLALDGAGQVTVSEMSGFQTGTFDVRTATDKVVSNLVAGTSTVFNGSVTGNGTVRFNGANASLNLSNVSVASSAKLELNGGNYTVSNGTEGKLSFTDNSTIRLASNSTGQTPDQSWAMTFYTTSTAEHGRVVPGGAYNSATSKETSYNMDQAANNPTNTEVAKIMTTNYASLSYLTMIHVSEDLKLDFSGQFDDTQGVWVRECGVDGSPLQGSEWVQLLGYSTNCATNTATGVSLKQGTYMLDVRVCDESGNRYAMAGVKDASGKALGIGMRLNGAANYCGMDIDQTTGVLNGSGGKIIAGTPYLGGIQTWENASFDVAEGKTVNLEVPTTDSQVTGYELTSPTITGTGTFRLSNDSGMNVPFTVTDLTTAGNLTIGANTTVTELSGTVKGVLTVENGAVVNFTVAAGNTEPLLEITGAADLGENTAFNVLVTGTLTEELQAIPVVTFGSTDPTKQVNLTWKLEDPNALATPYVDPKTGTFGIMIGTHNALPEPASWILFLAGIAILCAPPCVKIKKRVK